MALVTALVLRLEYSIINGITHYPPTNEILEFYDLKNVDRNI